MAGKSKAEKGCPPPYRAGGRAWDSWCMPIPQHLLVLCLLSSFFFLFLTSTSCLVIIFWEQRVIGNGYHPGVWRRGASKMLPGVEKRWREPSSLGTSRGLLLLVLSFFPSIGQTQLFNCLHFQHSWVFIGECTVSHASLSRLGPMASLSLGLGRSVSLGAPGEVL